jgi:hypothetical protein
MYPLPWDLGQPLINRLIRTAASLGLFLFLVDVRTILTPCIVSTTGTMSDTSQFVKLSLESFHASRAYDYPQPDLLV